MMCVSFCCIQPDEIAYWCYIIVETLVQMLSFGCKMQTTPASNRLFLHIKVSLKL